MSVSFEDAGDPGISDPPPLYVDPIDPRALDNAVSGALFLIEETKYGSRKMSNIVIALKAHPGKPHPSLSKCP